MSRGWSTSSYAGRPATTAVPSVLTRVVGVIALSAASAACCGVTGDAGREAARVASVGRGRHGAVGGALVVLDQVHRSVPLRTTSDSPSEPSRASRTWSGPAYHSRRVCEPATSEVRSELPLAARRRAGSAGRGRRSARSSRTGRRAGPSGRRRGAATALRCGSPPRALAVITPTAEPPAARRRAASSGTSQRRAGRRSKTVMDPACPTVAVRSLRTCVALSRGVPRWAHAAAGGRGRGAARACAAPRARPPTVSSSRSPRDGVSGPRAGPARRLRRGAPRRDAARGCPGTTWSAPCGRRRTGCRC